MTERSVPEPTKAAAFRSKRISNTATSPAQTWNAGARRIGVRSAISTNTISQGVSSTRPRIAIGILRLGASYERFGFGFPGVCAITRHHAVAHRGDRLDTQLAESILVRFEAQPGFYGTADDLYEAHSLRRSSLAGRTSTARICSSSSASA
jgi:hypothetical protein